MNDLVLLDIVGGVRHMDYHPYKNQLVYDAGSMVILWDLGTDAKSNLIEHEGDIVCTKFSEDGRHLFTLDGGLCPSLCYWLIADSASLVQHVYLPRKLRKVPIRDCRAADSRTTGVLLVLENEREGYRLSCWDTSKGTVSFVFVSDLDSAAYCHDLYFTNGGSVFATAESSCIKVWSANSVGARQEQRIHLPQPIIGAAMCALSRSMAVLTAGGKVVLLSAEGKYLSSLGTKVGKCSAISVVRDTLYLGTDCGNVEMYNVGSLTYTGGIQYSPELRESAAVPSQRSQDKLRHFQSGSAASGLGPRVTQILVDEKGTNICVMYGDSSVAIYSRDKNEMLSYMCGHFQRVSAVRWLSSKSQNCFVTCSHDMSLYLWQHSGDRWSFTYFDIPMLIDRSLRHYRLASSSHPATEEDPVGAHSELKLTALAAHPKQPYVACGSNRGAVWVLDVASGRLLSSFSAPNEERVADISFSPSGNFLAVAYCTGLVSMYDARANFERVLQIEEPLKANAASDKLSKLYYIGVILTKDPASRSTFASGDSPLNLSHSMSRAGFLHDPFPAKLLQLEEPAFYALCTHNISTVRMYKIYVRDGKFIKDVLVDLPVDEGKIAGFDIHPSREYATVLSDAGTIYVYHVHLAQLRGRVSVAKHAWGCRIDPSGLYVTVAAPSPSLDMDAESMAKQSNGTNFSVSVSEGELRGQDESGGSAGRKRRRLQVFEIGTGELATEVNNICDVSAFDYSRDGRYIVIGSDKGMVTVWAQGGNMRDSATQVLDAMALNPDFWSNYPIYLPVDPAPVSDPIPAAIDVGPSSPPPQVQEIAPPAAPLLATNLAASLRGNGRLGKKSALLSVPALHIAQPAVSAVVQPLGKSRPAAEILTRSKSPETLEAERNLAATLRTAYVHPPQPVQLFQTIDPHRVTQGRISTQCARSLQGPAMSELATSPLDTGKRFQRGSTFYGAVNALYKKAEPAPKLQTTRVRPEGQTMRPAPATVRVSPLDLFHPEFALDTNLPSAGMPESAPAVDTMIRGGHAAAQLYRSQEEAIATLLERVPPALKTRVSAAVSASPLTEQVREDAFRANMRIMPDPEDIDREELEDQSDLGPGERNYKPQISAERASVTGTTSQCEVVERMYEDMQAFEARQQPRENNNA